MTRENYLAHLFPDGVPAEITPEIEDQLPEHLQLNRGAENEDLSGLALSRK